ncbi:helix-turn-helix transcriptional regulator [Paenibacillus sp. HB172176]|uniref:helix-turn-helix transcriptional regulator n=1 Tax=Paenibacillus sp. HB172176 TaxID=2493690 RepID=UPI003211E25E
MIEIVKAQFPITSDQIAELLKVNRATLRSDLSILVMLGFLDAKPKVGYFPGNQTPSQSNPFSKLDSLKVKDVQSVPIALSISATVQEAVVELFLENVGSLFVTDQRGALAGMVSRKDLLKVTLGNQSAGSMPIALVMTRTPHLVTISPEESVLAAASKLIASEVGALPVVKTVKDEHGADMLEPVGRISKTTMTEILLKLAWDQS